MELAESSFISHLTLSQNIDIFFTKSSTDGEISIGDNCSWGTNIQIGASEGSIYIGNDVQIASNVVRAAIVLTIFSALANAVAPIFAALSSTAWLTESMQTWLQRASKAIIWIIGIAIALEIFGIQIGPLVAGLGLFSVAVALGAQDLFKNLISGILIIGENRFQPGDRIEVPGALHGIVETIGFRSTVIRTFDTAPMIIPNKDLSDVKLINHGEMQYRRINWTIRSNSCILSRLTSNRAKL